MSSKTEEHKFWIDEKVTVWNRIYVKIQADSFKEAVEIVRASIDKNEYDCLDYMIFETLSDTEETLGIEENQGYPTLELYDKNPKYQAHPIWTNSET